MKKQQIFINFKEIRNELFWYADNYNLIVNGEINYNKIKYLGDKDNRVCRFCGCQEQNMFFGKVAHAFPESTSNRYLATNYECKTCNEFFGNTIEDDYAKYFMFAHNTFGVSGKSHKSPKYIEEEENVRTKSYEWQKAGDKERYVIKIVRDEDDTGFFDFSKHEKILEATAQTHTPIGVFKTFIKMALSIMPKEKMGIFTETIKWLRYENYNRFHNEKNVALLCKTAMIEGYNVIPHIRYRLYERKYFTKSPVFLFNISYKSLSFLVEIPYARHIPQYGIKQLPFPPLKSKHEYFYYKLNECGCPNFNGTEKVRNLKQKITVNIGSYEEVSPDKYDSLGL
jgi:hypothetical protein